MSFNRIINSLITGVKTANNKIYANIRIEN